MFKKVFCVMKSKDLGICFVTFLFCVFACCVCYRFTIDTFAPQVLNLFVRKFCKNSAFVFLCCRMMICMSVCLMFLCSNVKANVYVCMSCVFMF